MLSLKGDGGSEKTFRLTSRTGNVKITSDCGITPRDFTIKLGVCRCLEFQGIIGEIKVPVCFDFMFSIHDPVSQCRARMLKLSFFVFFESLLLDYYFQETAILPRSWLVRKESEGMFIFWGMTITRFCPWLVDSDRNVSKYPMPGSFCMVKLNYEVKIINIGTSWKELFVKQAIWSTFEFQWIFNTVFVPMSPAKRDI